MMIGTVAEKLETQEPDKIWFLLSEGSADTSKEREKKLYNVISNCSKLFLARWEKLESGAGH